MNVGDFKYNDTPIFNVGFSDFCVIIESLNSNTRLLSRNIERSDLRDFYTKKGTKFGIQYEGIRIDLSKL